MSLSIEDAQQLKALVVQPMIDAVQAELKPIVEANKRQDEAIASQGERIGRLEGSQKKALAGWGLISAFGAVVIGSAWGWLKSKVRWG